MSQSNGSSVTRVLVIGSINMDLVVTTPAVPQLGETLMGEGFATHAGGKGANQAVAAARLGARVAMVGRVGRDAFGAQLKAGLAAEGVDVQWVRETDGVPTGVAAITVSQADNAIIVVGGANLQVTPADLDAAQAAFAEADVVLVQLEVPLATVEHAAALAERHGKPFILNPAPAQPLPAALLARCALITPNEYELAISLGQAAGAPQGWQQQLATLPGRVAMTKGGEGAFHVDAQGRLHHQPGFAVQPVDTTGAGDTFNGALAAFWPQGVTAAMRLACAAAALSVTRPGAQGGMPTRAQLDAFLAEAGESAVRS
ncbi:MAG: ribokinase [Comamonas sp.]